MKAADHGRETDATLCRQAVLNLAKYRIGLATLHAAVAELRAGFLTNMKKDLDTVMTYLKPVNLSSDRRFDG